MIEYPEGVHLAKQIEELMAGLCIQQVKGPTKHHKFCFFNSDVESYESNMIKKSILSAENFGIFVQCNLTEDWKFCFNDGVNVRYLPASQIPKDYQLCLIFNNDYALVMTVAMAGGIYLFQHDWDNEYYQLSKNSTSVLAPDFSELFQEKLSQCKPTLSIKAFLATEQRFPGVGNGALQDICFEARLHPKTKLFELSKEETERLLKSVVGVIKKITEQNGRSTEKDCLGQSGNYLVKLSKDTYKSGCPICGQQIIKEVFLGGAIYYCQACQAVKKK